jgi:hypothetical protein
LGLCLAGHNRITYVGEAVRTVELIQQETTARGVPSFEDRVCTCGKDAESCPIWGAVSTGFESAEWSTTREGYTYLLDEIESHYSSSQIIVDSSKGTTNLEITSDCVGGYVAPIYLIRDVRGWVDSQQRNYSGSQKWGGIRDYLIHTTPGAVARWYKLNTEMKESLAEYDHFQVGYEELCLQPDEILSAIAGWLELEFTEEMTSPTASNNHLIRGNRMKDNPDKLGGIYYDNRWFYNSKQLVLGWMFLPVFRWNIKNVYQNFNGRRAGISIYSSDEDDS